MNFDAYDIRAYGSKAILIQWRAKPSHALFLHLSAVRKMLEERFDCEVILTYQEVLLKNLPATKEHIQDVALCLRKNTQEIFPPQSQRRISLPVCYEAHFGADLETLAKAKSITSPALIALHTEPEYLVYFLGFLPGFPYLLGLDERLFMLRKGVPSRELVAGSVAIGGEQTGIYPQNSPGGWHVIGHCPIPLFDAAETEASLFLAGDLIRFDAITIKEHQELSKMSLTAFKQSSYISNG